MYQDKWTSALDKTLSHCHELANVHHPFAIKVMKAGSTVGYLLKKISSTFLLFIMNGGVILFKLSNPNRKYSKDLAQGGLKMPCVITLKATRNW